MKRLFLLDAYALIFRAYYGFINKPLVNSKGQVTSAIYGFTKTLQDVLGGQKMPEANPAWLDESGLLRPDCIAVCFDPKGGTFRHEQFPSYKAQREATPEDIIFAVPWIKKIIEAYRIPIIEVPNYEADDVVGTMSRLADESGEFETFMMSPDKDYAQLVTDHSVIFKPKSFGPGYEILDTEAVLKKYGLKRTSQVIDMLGLQGDSADNIPGCPGVGPKTAQKLIEDFDSVENLIATVEAAAAEGKKELPNLKKGMFAKVADNIQQIKDSKYLATICLDVPGTVLDAEALKVETPDYAKLADIFNELEFRKMRDEVKAKIINATLFVEQSAPVATAAPIVTPASPATPATPASPTASSSQPSLTEGRIAGIRDIQTNYIIADTPDKRQDLVSELFWTAEWAFDTETTSLNIIDAELVGISFAVADHKAWYVPVPADQREARAIVEELRPVFENDAALKIAQNAKYDYSILKRYGVEVAYPLFDTMIAHYLLEPEQPHNMDYLSEIYLGYKPIPTSALIDTGKKKKAAEADLDLFAMMDAAEDDGMPKTMRDCPVEQVAEYCCEDSDVTYQLAQRFRPMLKKENLLKLFTEVEMPLVRVLADMELTGVRLDVGALTESKAILEEEQKRLEQRLAEIVGHPFNPLSPKVVAQVIFDELRLDPKAKNRSTAEDVLVQLKSRLEQPEHLELIDGILNYRGNKKLLGTYIEALPLEINPRTHRIHCQFNQTVTATGRLSSSNPNLQNIPIRDATGRELRKAFVPDEGEVFFSADYSQIELRLMAHLSQDPNMVEAFLEGDDIHRATAAKIYHVPLDQVTKLERTKAKTANFGIIYGISTFGLASRLNIPRGEAKQLIDGYFSTYPRVKEYMDESIRVAREKGYVETLFGRRRMLKDIHSANATVRGYAERNAINAPIQGTAADIIKIAMVRIWERIRREKLHAKLLIQVHDELNFTVPPQELERLTKVVLEEMSGVVKLSVPLIADCGSGPNWLAAH
ncbi:MAG: DNA polymerase I [Bacteroidales bacterium]|nr:DNA polymerase I [Bacteroidales bacterium]